MKTATDIKILMTNMHVVHELAKANELNGLYKRFDNYYFSAECEIELNSLLLMMLTY